MDSGTFLIAPALPPRPPGPAFPGVYSGTKETSRVRQAAEASDAVLLERIARRDMEAFQAFYRRYAGRVLAYARQLGRRSDLAEDVVQEVFVAVWRKAASFQAGRGDPCGWLYTITRNKLDDLWRKAGEPESLDGLDLQRLASPEGEGSELLITMRQALTQVAPDQRAAIEMAYFGGLTYEETAERLRLPLGTLKSRIRSGLKTLRTLLESR
jgi:RNA polymerase sigma-70 factor (ECF subfamily)